MIIEAWAVVDYRGKIVRHARGLFGLGDTPEDMVITDDEQHAISSCDHNHGERVVKVTITVEV